MSYTESVERLIAEFSKIPGIGRRTAERCAFYVLRTPPEEALKLAEAVRDVKQRVRPCKECANLSETETCRICADTTRDRGLVCVVEQPKDVLAIEESGAWRGLYHVLMGTVSALDGVGPEDLAISLLRERVRRGGIRELILATNPTVEGDGTALAVREAVRELREGTGNGGAAIRVTRIARGIPTGASIEYMSAPILADALEGRRDFA